MPTGVSSLSSSLSPRDCQGSGHRPSRWEPSPDARRVGAPGSKAPSSEKPTSPHGTGRGRSPLTPPGLPEVGAEQGPKGERLAWAAGGRGLRGAGGHVGQQDTAQGAVGGTFQGTCCRPEHRALSGYIPGDLLQAEHRPGFS